MSKKAKRNTAMPVAKKEKISFKRVLLICVCAFLAVVVVVGSVLGITTAIRRSGYVMEYGSVGIDEGVAKYLASYYKTQYLSNLASGGIAASDTDDFWNSTVYGANTYGSYFEYSFKDYVTQLVAANNIFDTYAKLTAEDKRVIDTSIMEVLQYKAQNSKSTFNQNAAKHGFDFDDFRRATEMIYKGWAAKTKMLGNNGENASLYPEFCNSYLNNYSHVYLTFVRTETTFVLDDKGNRVKDEQGNDRLRPLTDEERLKREEAIGILQTTILGVEDGTIAPERYFELMKLYDEGDSGSHTKGYYFMRGSKYTEEFFEAFSSVVDEATAMPQGSASMIDCSIGKCFIYRAAVEAGAYTDTNAAWCFSDFYSLAANGIYQQLLSEGAKAVTVKDKWEQINPVSIPKNTDFIARF